MALPDSSTPELCEPVTKLGYEDVEFTLGFVAEESRPLVRKIDSAHAHCGKPGFGATSKIKIYTLQFLLDEEHANKFLARVNNDLRLLNILGLKKAPSESAYSDFKNWKLTDRIPQLNAIIARAVEACRLQIERLRSIGSVPEDAPPVGESLAIDKTDVETYANHRAKHPVDPDASWGYRTCKNGRPKRGRQKGRKVRDINESSGTDGTEDNYEMEPFIGYGVDALADAYWGIPLLIITCTATENESRHFKEDLESLLQFHPRLSPRHVIADKACDSRGNYKAASAHGIHAIIPLTRLPVDQKTGQRRLHEGIYTNDGLPTCIGGKPMKFLGTDSEGDHWFTCDWEGCHLKRKIDWSKYCDFEHSEKPEGKLLRVMGSINRSSLEWNGLYNMRPVIEILQQRQALQAAGHPQMPEPGAGYVTRHHVLDGLRAQRPLPSEGRGPGQYATHAYQADTRLGMPYAQSTASQGCIVPYPSGTRKRRRISGTMIKGHRPCTPHQTVLPNSDPHPHLVLQRRL